MDFAGLGVDNALGECISNTKVMKTGQLGISSVNIQQFPMVPTVRAGTSWPWVGSGHWERIVEDLKSNDSTNIKYLLKAYKV